MMAYRNLIRRKTRAILSISGIIVGVTMILVLLSLAAGTSASTTKLLRSAVTAQITVTNSTTPTLGGFSPPSGGRGFGNSSFGGGFGNRTFSSNQTQGGGSFASFFGAGNTIPQSYVNTISGLSGVYAVSAQLSSSGYIDNSSVLLYGINPTSFSQTTTGLDIVNGSMLTSK